MPKRLRDKREGQQQRERETWRVLGGDKRGLEPGQKDEEEMRREKEKKGWRVKIEEKKIVRQRGGRGPKCKKEQSVET